MVSMEELSDLHLDLTLIWEKHTPGIHPCLKISEFFIKLYRKQVVESLLKNEDYVLMAKGK